ncbi:hypothetical protein HU200_005686 [Digitaria exilis]|uniref:Uncharacterized protein n=1 Tax=Digitaria exilis TaxID=1010633 RepID=A0A835KSP8_9POAL|nr:hypothetical protein HU200_005686 [Digitaria exilis]
MNTSGLIRRMLPSTWSLGLARPTTTLLVHQVPEMAQAAHDEHLVICRISSNVHKVLPLGGGDPPEGEGDAELASAAAEAASSLLDVERGAEARLGEVDAGDPHRRRATVPGGEATQQPRPLEPIAEAVVDDVEAAVAGDGVEDGLVGEGKGHLLAAAGGHEELVGFEEINGGGWPDHQRVVEPAAIAGEASFQALGEAVASLCVASPVGDEWRRICASSECAVRWSSVDMACAHRRRSSCRSTVSSPSVMELLLRRGRPRRRFLSPAGTCCCSTPFMLMSRSFSIISSNIWRVASSSYGSGAMILVALSVSGSGAASGCQLFLRPRAWAS